MHKHWAAMSVVVVAALTLLSGVIQGTIRHRWGQPAKMLEASEKLKQIPSQFGTWKLAKMKTTEEVDDAEVDMLEAASYTVRDYHSDGLRNDVVVTLLLGATGPIAAHTPDVCLPSYAHRTRGERKKVSITNADAASDCFWALTYQENNAEGKWRRVYYAWSDGGPWSAPDDARFKFAGSPYLYKVQVSGNFPAGADPENDVCRKFLREFVPKLKDCLVQPEVN
jgi:hypothetical protein